MSWSEWINGILGLWVIWASYMYVASGTGRVLMIITGLIVAVLGFWGGATEPHQSSSSNNRLMQR
jgi:hypothetical protein